MVKYLSIFFLLQVFIFPAHAYIGPGMAGGFIAAILGFIAAILIALFGILYYPIKRAFKNRKDKTLLEKKRQDESE